MNFRRAGLTYSTWIVKLSNVLGTGAFLRLYRVTLLRVIGSSVSADTVVDVTSSDV